MKPFYRLSLLLLLFTALVTSCKKSVPKQTRHIPKNALFVMAVNSKSLQNKLLKSQASIENIMKSAAGNDTSANKGKQEWEDLKNAGIDFDDNFYVSAVQKGDMASGKGSMVLSAFATLKDAAKLENYIKKKDPKAEIRKEKDYSYANVAGENMVAWAKDLVVVMSYQRSNSGGMEYDSTTGSFDFKKPANSEADIKSEMASYFNLKEDQSVASIPEFRDLMTDKSDASFWINSSSSMDNIPFPLPKLKELFANAFTAATLNFEDGKIVANSKSYYGKELKDILKKHSGPTADLGLVENYPSNNINGFMVFAFNPELINGVVKFLEVGSMVDGFLTKAMGTNFTLQDALKAIKGDMAVVVSDFAMPAQNNMTPGKTPVQMIANIPVGDKTQMNRIMDKLVEGGMMAKTGNQYQLSSAMAMAGVQVMADDKNVFITTDLNLLNQYKAKSKKAGFKKDALDNLKGKSGIVYIDVEGILNGVPATGDIEGDKALTKAKETFKDMKMYSENFNGEYLEGHFELKFRNEKENSLTSLINFFETTASSIRKSATHNKMNDSMGTDSIVLPTDTSTFMQP